MPELPEVETVRRGLQQVMEGFKIVGAEARRKDLRFPFQKDFLARLIGQTVTGLGRRAKYLMAALQSGHLAGCAMDVGRAPDQMPTPRLAARADVIATPHTAGLTLPAIEHQSMETVAQAGTIAKGRAPKGAVNAKHWTRKVLLK